VPSQESTHADLDGALIGFTESTEPIGPGQAQVPAWPTSWVDADAGQQ
jgi:hypothetical protein